MFVILANSASMAAYDYSDRNSISTHNQIIDKITLAFQAIFVAEAVLKIMAFGFFMRHNSYLRSGWNIIDFIVILFG